MKLKGFIFWVALVIVLSLPFGLAKAAEPMNEEEVKIYKKYEGKWGEGAWVTRNTKRKAQIVEFQIKEIDITNRKVKVIYSLGEGRTTKASKATYSANCEDGRLIFDTSKNRIELMIKGNDELFAERKGNDPAQVILKRIQ